MGGIGTEELKGDIVIDSVEGKKRKIGEKQREGMSRRRLQRSG
jgi:hypothetical protein